MPFINARLLDCVSYGTQGGPTWNTRVVPLRSGVERRNAKRTRPQYRFIVLYQNLKPEDHESVFAAFNACRGKLYSFRLKDWTDFVATSETLPLAGTGGAQSQQLVRRYTFGGETLLRPIRKPVSGTVSLRANGSPISATIDYTTGIATYTATGGAVITWSGEFDVPVTFAQDDLMFDANSRDGEGLALTTNVDLLEDLSQ